MLLAAVAAVSLLVGGIGIMNIMLVSVTERTREIGLRLAVGARPRDILGQFLIEATTLATIGGALGVGLGVGAAYAVAQAAGWPSLVSANAISRSRGRASRRCVGIFFGFYPAQRAARLDPSRRCERALMSVERRVRFARRNDGWPPDALLRRHQPGSSPDRS